VKYFAYGSDMFSKALGIHVPSNKFYSIGSLEGYALKFHKNGIDNSGECNAAFTNDSDDIVYGIIYDIDEKEKVKLDKAYGIGEGCNEDKVVINTKAGEVEALMYETDPDFIDDSLQPFNWYKDFVLKGATENDLPPEYIKEIEKIESRADPNIKRSNNNYKLLKT
jgi:gamma-glutamylcyclotransferase (GGCT)/AIG2-like uncharacterized protein YtfP